MNAGPPAGFWIRAIAAIVDFAVIAFVQASYGLASALVFGADAERAWDAAGTIGFFTIVFAAAYTSIMHATDGQTLGKALMRVRVVALDGAPPAGGAAVLRFLAYGASVMTFGFGFLIAALRTDKRALHDLIAGTRVERLRPRVRVAPPPPNPVDDAPPVTSDATPGA